MFLALTHAEIKLELGLLQFEDLKALMLKIEMLNDSAGDKGCKPLGGPGRDVHDATCLEHAGDVRISTVDNVVMMLFAGGTPIVGVRCRF